jgi:hypothetical protein
MPDEFEFLEAELKSLTPAAPSAELASRIDAELHRPAHGARPVWWAALGALPLAAAVAVLVAWPMGRRTPSPASPKSAADVLKPIAAQQVLYSAADEGLVTLDDGTMARRQRLQFVDTIKWQNPRTHASLTWSVPREEVRMVPVRFQ